ncbi:hypothetical protein [Eubacterium callanderi]
MIMIHGVDYNVKGKINRTEEREIPLLRSSFHEGSGEIEVFLRRLIKVS